MMKTFVIRGPRAQLDRGLVALAVLCLAQFVLILDAAVVAIALPAIQADLAMGTAQLQALATAYAVTFGGCLILAGRAADIVGARRMFLVGISLFTAASALCALAPSASALLAARAAQGLAAATASPAALALLMAAFTDSVGRTRAFAAWGAVAAGGAVAWQILGGLIIDALDWRWIFLINLPIGTAVLAAGATLLPTPTPTARGARLDAPGAAWLTGGLVLLVLAATKTTEGGIDATTAALAAGGIVALALFLAHERRAAAPLIRPQLLARVHVRPATPSRSSPPARRRPSSS